MMDSDLKTPERGIKFPSGHILMHEKWRNSELGRQFTKQGNVNYSDAMGLVDFYIAQHCPVVYIAESDLVISPEEVRKKISKFHNVFKGKGIVLMVWNMKTTKDFMEIQEYAVLDHGLFVFPVGCQEEIPAALKKLAIHCSRSPTKAQVKKKSNATSTLERQLALLTTIQGIGEEKAKMILQRFGNIVAVSEASIYTLTEAVGPKAAGQIYHFFNSNIVKS